MSKNINYQNTEYHSSTVVINGKGGRPSGGATSNAVVNAARRRGEVHKGAHYVLAAPGGQRVQRLLTSR